MEKKTIASIIEKLLAAKEIIIAAGEEKFADLGWRKKTEIYKSFFDDFKSDGDGDSDGSYEWFAFGGDGFRVTFSSSCSDSDDFERDMRDMYFDYLGDQFDASLDTIDAAVAYLQSLVPEVVGLLNTSILTAPGDYSLKTITLSDAKKIAQNYTLDSAIGHASTAQIMTTLLGIEVPVNRQMFAQGIGQQCLVFKLRGRPEEGKILTAEEIEKIGYDWQLLTRKS